MAYISKFLSHFTGTDEDGGYDNLEKILTEGAGDNFWLCATGSAKTPNVRLEYDPKIKYSVNRHSKEKTMGK